MRTETLLPVQVFATLLNCFDVANASSLVVGVNLVGQENGVVAMQDFWLHMRFIRYLKARYPSVNISLHAGELVAGMDNVAPESVTFHIHDSIFVGGATRIGHGVDIPWEDNSTDLLDYIANNNVVLEFCLTSNEFILGVLFDSHPMALYLSRGVNIVMGSDDPGINRGAIGIEYLKLLNRYPFVDYQAMKQMIMNSILYSFIKEADVKISLVNRLQERFTNFEARMSRVASKLSLSNYKLASTYIEPSTW